MLPSLSNSPRYDNPAHASWHHLYQILKLKKIKNFNSYQVNDNLYIVIPLEDNNKIDLLHNKK